MLVSLDEGDADEDEEEPDSDSWAEEEEEEEEEKGARGIRTSSGRSDSWSWVLEEHMRLALTVFVA